MSKDALINDEQINKAKPEEKISEFELLKLENLKLGKHVAMVNAEKALSENNVAELKYQMFVMQLAYKYNLKNVDVIESDGKITRNEGK